MNSDDTRNRKHRLRMIVNHLQLAHNELGVERDSIGFVEVVHHPTSILPSLNYIVPRQNTAMVPSTDVLNGIVALRDHRRDVRVLYVDDLLPLFANSLERNGLEVNISFPLWIIAPPSEVLELPENFSITVIPNQDGIDIWQLIWSNSTPNYDIYDTPLEPLLINKQYSRENTVFDVILYHHSSPIAVARLTHYDETIHLMARAIVSTPQSSRIHQWLLHGVAQIAYDLESEFLFVCDSDIEPLLKASNIDCQHEGNMLCYVDEIDDGGEIYDPMEQPVLPTG